MQDEDLVIGHKKKGTELSVLKGKLLQELSSIITIEGKTTQFNSIIEN